MEAWNLKQGDLLGIFINPFGQIQIRCSTKAHPCPVVRSAHGAVDSPPVSASELSPGLDATASETTSGLSTGSESSFSSDSSSDSEAMELEDPRPDVLPKNSAACEDNSTAK